jgi:hypothetical protein
MSGSVSRDTACRVKGIELDPAYGRRRSPADQWVVDSEPLRSDCENEESREAVDPPGDGGQGVCRRLIDPLHVLDDHHNGVRPAFEEVEEAGECPVAFAVQQRLFQSRVGGSGQFQQWTERDGCQQIIASTPQRPGRRPLLEEGAHQRRLAAAGLGRDDHQTTGAAPGGVQGCGEHTGRSVTFEQIHGRRR